MSQKDEERVIISGPVGGYPFGYKGAKKTCLWCGRKLRAYRWRNTEYNRGSGRTHGDYGDNAFCGLRCGYLFACRIAKLGHRLVFKGKEE